jgi:uncharacterized membrane protein YgcG
MTTMNSKMLVAAVTTATLAMGATTAKADHYVRSCGVRYAGYAPAYYRPVYAPAPVVYTAPAYAYAPYRPVTYVEEPVYYPRYYAPAPVYRSYYAPAPVYQSYYAPSSFSFGFGYGRGGHGGNYGGGFSISGGHVGFGGYRSHGRH